jgi:cyclophilin family peptidyl-prolyl cis-trans isomerase
MTKIAAVLLLVGCGLSGAAQAHKVVAKAEAVPAGPTVVIDTTMGRMTCKLYSKQAPVTVARFVGLAEGTVDWTDGANGAVMHGKPFYDGLAVNGASDGIVSGDRLGERKGVAGPAVAIEKSGLGYDKAGRLVMAKVPAAAGSPKGTAAMESSSMFFVLDHADEEYEGRGATVFGQCDDASVAVLEAISHKLLTVDNHPDAPVAINHISVVRESEPMPAVAKDVAAETVTPRQGPMPVSALASPEPSGPMAVIDTTMGTITCRLFKDETPIATSNFIGLANGTKDWKMPASHALMHGKRFYDGLSFARVIPDFMIQNADLPGDAGGDGDIGFKFGNEIVPGLTFDRPGRLAYANAGPGTNESEFFVTEHPIHRLDGNYTIFGQCDEASVKVVEAIARVPRDKKNRPLKAVVIRRITIEAAKS